LVNEIILYI